MTTSKQIVNGVEYDIMDREAQAKISSITGEMMMDKFNPSFVNPDMMAVELINGNQRDNYEQANISGGKLYKYKSNGFYIPSGIFPTGKTEAYLTTASFQLEEGQKYTLFVRYKDDFEIGISIKGKKSGEEFSSTVQDENGNNVASREKNKALVYTVGYDYSNCYVCLYKTSENQVVFDNFLIGVYLAPGEWTDDDFDRLMMPEKEKDLIFTNINYNVFEKNLVEGTQYGTTLTNGNLIVDKVYFSGFRFNGTLDTNIARYISRGKMHIEAGKTYSMFIQTRKKYNGKIAFALRHSTPGGESSYEYIDDINGRRVSIRNTNDVYYFTPLKDYTNVYLTAFQSTGSDMVFENDIFYIYIAEGVFTKEDFGSSAYEEEKDGTIEGVSEEILKENLFEGTQYIPSLVNDGLEVQYKYYSGMQINGTLVDNSPRYISRGAMPVRSDTDYTMFVKTDYPAGNNLAFGLRVTVEGESHIITMNGENISTRALNTAYHFRPDNDYDNVHVSIFQNTGDEITIDDMNVYVYIVPGFYNNEDFDTLSSYEIEEFQERDVAYGLRVGLPFLYLDGDVASMTKDIQATVNWKYNFDKGTATLKWQGASSVAYSKKNYTIKFNKKLDFGWGEQKKYVLKGNYIDNTNALNVCGAKLWASIVGNRGENPAIEAGANNGAMDGFPVVVIMNGKFFGLYTLNTPKDQWTFGMEDSDTEWIVTAEDHTQATRFKATTTLDGEDFELEYAAEGVSSVTVAESLNRLINSVINSSGSDWETTVGQYVDVDSVIDYMIYSALITNIDGIDKNFILTTYDGEKWWFNAYDVDSTFGLYWNGGSYVKTTDAPTSFAGQNSTSRLFHLVYTYSTAKLIERYDELRGTLLSENNIHDLFYNFCAVIPKEVLDMDNKLYPYKPGTYTETLSRIMENYRLRCKYIDSEIDALRGE